MRTSSRSHWGGRVAPWAAAALVGCAAGTTASNVEPPAQGSAPAQAVAGGAIAGEPNAAGGVAPPPMGPALGASMARGEAMDMNTDTAAVGAPAQATATLTETAPGTYRLELGPRALEVSVGQGARVLSLSLDGRNVLRPLERGNGFLNGGSTLWTSPQSDWSWPPLAAHDEAPYQASVEGAALVTTGTAADVAGTRVSLGKRFSAEPEREAMRLDYTLRNEGVAAARLAAWEVSRHPTGGLTFWPGSDSRGALSPRQIGAHQWLSYDELWSGSDGKVFADASAGWLAHAQDGLLVVRTWSDVPAAQQAPGEAEVEVYLAAGYVELEVQGPHVELSPGAATEFSVRWHVLPIPEGTDVDAGSDALVTLARSVL